MSPASQRIARLQAEAREIADEQTERLIALLQEAATLAAEIADGGDNYPVGVREVARRARTTIVPDYVLNLQSLATRPLQRPRRVA